MAVDDAFITPPGLQVRDVRHTFPPGRYHIVP